MTQLYIDLDGVWADFDKLAWEILGEDPRAFEEREGSDFFWYVLRTWRSEAGKPFFEALELTSDALVLYGAIKHLNPIILTGYPKQIPSSAFHKQNWVREKFGEEQPVITCLSKYKRLYCKPGDIIVDDWPKHRHLWEEAGGIWVLHTSAEDSINQLKELGVL